MGFLFTQIYFPIGFHFTQLKVLCFKTDYLDLLRGLYFLFNKPRPYTVRERERHLLFGHEVGHLYLQISPFYKQHAHLDLIPFFLDQNVCLHLTICIIYSVAYLRLMQL